MKRLIAAAACMALLGTQSKAEELNSINLALNSMGQLQSCLEYTIHGLTLRVIITPYGYYYFYTPNVSHNSPDLLSMSHREINQMPYTEFNSMMSSSISSASEKMMAGTVGASSGANAEVGGGRYMYDGWGSYQAGQHMESTVVGNPSAMVIEAFSWNGYSPPQNNDNSAVNARDSDDYIDSWSSNTDTTMPSNMQNAMGYTVAMNAISNTPVIQFIKQLIQQLDSMLSSMDVKIGDSPFCPVNPTPFEAYYISSLDPGWRWGYPFVDTEYANIILNPVSDDVIGKDNEEWGNIYPRDGGLNHLHTEKAAVVIAARSQDILENGGTGRVYREPKYKWKKAAWASVYPKFSEQCHLKIANTEIKKDEKDQYAWNIWTKHRCDLFRVGIPVVLIPIGPIHFTPEVPE